MSSKPKKRLQCVQAFESTLAFVRRILAEDGVSIWVEHGDSEDVVVFGDGPSACHDLPGGASLAIVPEGGLLGGEAVSGVHVSHRITHDGAAVGDYDPDHPLVDQNASVGGNKYPLFVFPGHLVSLVIGTLMVLFGLIMTFAGKEPSGIPGWLPSMESTWRGIQNGLMLSAVNLAPIDHLTDIETVFE